MYKRLNRPIALTIAGSDSGGGAGIQADLKTFAALDVHGTSAITCLTAQNPRGVTGIQAATPKLVRQQIEAVFDELPPRAVKTGMLFSAAIIREVGRALAERRSPHRRVSKASRQPGAVTGTPPLIVDPVMIATSGARLLKLSAMRSLLDDLVPLATLVTPNLDETEILVGRRLRDVEGLRGAARDIRRRFGCAALVKGGHLKGARDAVDVFWDGERELILGAPFVRGVSTHGTGCTYSAAITGYLALGCELPYAVQLAKRFITLAIKQSARIGKHTALNVLWEE